MATNLRLLEDDLIARVAQVCASNGVSVAKLNAYELSQPMQSGQAFINYGGVSPSEVLSFQGQVISTFRFDFVVRYANLSTHDQAYPLLGSVKDRFRDYKPLGRLCVKPMRLTKEKPPTIPQMLDGFWIYIQEYEFDLLEV